MMPQCPIVKRTWPHKMARSRSLSHVHIPDRTSLSAPNRTDNGRGISRDQNGTQFLIFFVLSTLSMSNWKVHICNDQCTCALLSFAIDRHWLASFGFFFSNHQHNFAVTLCCVLARRTRVSINERLSGREDTGGNRQKNNAHAYSSYVQVYSRFLFLSIVLSFSLDVVTLLLHLLSLELARHRVYVYTQTHIGKASRGIK
jgi:hypothetical protein